MEHNKKEILITRESRLQDIQDAFSCFYPFLRIEHFQNRGAYLDHTVLASEKNLKMPTNLETPVTLDVSSRRTVSEVMLDVARLFRVNVQICRKSGNVWNAVSLTGNWTLERQNAAGEYISGLM